MNSLKDIAIYVFHYKNGEAFPAHEKYTHIWAGKNGNQEITSLIGDDSGDSISEKNFFYSELTGIYWIWKNKPSEIVGTCHYRRFYTLQHEPLIYRLKRLLYYPIGLSKKRFGLIYTNNKTYWENFILTSNKTQELLNEFDVIMPKRRKLKYSVEEHYTRYHDKNDLKMIESILQQKYPEFLPAFKTTLSNNRLYANNMFVMKWFFFDEMATWLFDILFEFEKRVDLNQYTGYQQRIMGFLSERLITTWMNHHQLNMIELPLIYFKHFKTKE